MLKQETDTMISRRSAYKPHGSHFFCMRKEKNQVGFSLSECPIRHFGDCNHHFRTIIDKFKTGFSEDILKKFLQALLNEMLQDFLEPRLPELFLQFPFRETHKTT